MLDTSNIPIGELPEAMYNESMKSFGDALSLVYGCYKINMEAVNTASEVFNDAIARKDYNEAYYDIVKLTSCVAELHKSCIRLQGALYCKPKKPEKSNQINP